MFTPRIVRDAARAGLMFLALASAVAAQTVTPIADIHADLAGFTGDLVTVVGTVTVPGNYRGPNFYSGYIQDGSGRGINIFGGSTAAAPPALTTVGNVVRVTGEVAVFGSTTVELINMTEVTLLSSGTPPAPIQLTTQAANDTRWEGTFLEVNGTVASSASAGGAQNYTINDGSGNFVVRVYATLGVPTIASGTPIQARGAGTNFSGTYQIYVGRASDVVSPFVPGTDTQPPTLVGAWAATATTVQITYNEPVAAATAGSPGSYQVFETATPGNTATVSSVAVSGPIATLTLAASLTSATGYTVTVTGVGDVPGNTMPAPESRTFTSRTIVTDTTPPTLAGASATSLTSVTATFNEAIDPVTGGTAANYTIFLTSNPATTIGVSSATVSGATATLALAASLTAGSNYSLRAQAVADLAGNAMPAQQTVTFNAPGGGTITPIATIHANLLSYLRQTVTVQGQVYIPTNYRAPATTISGYIQDGSGRGINLFGNSANNPALQNIGNIVQVTGMVDTFGVTTVEILNLTNVTLLSGGNPPLQPTRLTTGAAATSAWEGTFIEVTGRVSSTFSTGGTSPATNYNVDDGSGSLVVRVINSLGAPTFAAGDVITGRGAGSHFRTDYQILVGLQNGIFAGGASDSTITGIGLSGPPYTFLPRQGEVYPITVMVPLGTSEILLRIFDLNGRLKRTLFDSRYGTLVSNSTVVNWDGRDDRTEVVPAGTYIAHLVVTPKQASGDRDQTHIPIVVATRLDRGGRP